MFVTNLQRVVTLTIIASGLLGSDTAPSKISQVGDGNLSGDFYSNETLGLRYEVPSGWIATIAPNDPVLVDYPKLDKPRTQCQKMLLLSHPVQQGEGRFNSTATLFVIDPGCFPEANFPKSLSDKKGILKFADRMVKAFSKAPFISRNGVDIGAQVVEGKLFIAVTGDELINALAGRDRSEKQPLHVNTLLSLAESNGYWVAWTAVADDPSRDRLKDVKVQIRVP
jgi:hypothetical protein